MLNCVVRIYTSADMTYIFHVWDCPNTEDAARRALLGWKYGENGKGEPLEIEVRIV